MARVVPLAGMILGVLLLVFALFVSSPIVSAVLENVSQGELILGEAETFRLSGAGNISVEGSNVTEVNITHRTQSSWWQGVWGEVLVNFTLEDASGDTFYSWGVGINTGEIYFGNTSVTDFSNLATVGGIELAEHQLSDGWANSSGIDNLTNTYSPDNSHPGFTADELPVAADGTPAVNLPSGHNCTVLYLDGGGSEDFLWVALIAQDLSGYNGETTDYECLLPTRGMAAIETYFVYAELD